MKMIDFTPLVTMGYKKVLTRLAIASFAVALAVKMAGYQELASGLALGGAGGLLWGFSVHCRRESQKRRLKP